MTRVSDGIDRVPLLLSESADQEFRDQGFAVVPFVAPERLDALRQRMTELIPPDSGPFFTLYRNDTPEIRRVLDAAVREELQPQADAMMCNHRFYVGSILVKFPGEGSFLDPHQDWSFVDETQHVSGIVWLPLEATNEGNGGLSVVPGSHRFDLPYRGTPPEPIDQYLDGLVNVTTRPGEAVIYHNALIHGSSENQSDHPRIVMALGFVSKQADLVHFFTDNAGQKWRYRVADDLPFTYQPPSPPKGAAVLQVEPWPS
jgi:ectoine hydroxylase-related dioxygenase (phytanoyl-CoA dioxygenase family)